MDNFEDILFRKADSKVGFVSVATTGLDPDKDQVIGVCLIRTTRDPALLDHYAMIRTSQGVDMDKVQETYQYHGIDRDLMFQEGENPEEFKYLLRKWLEGCDAVYSYNRLFINGFLQPYGNPTVLDLPLLCRLASMGIPVPEDVDTPVRLDLFAQNAVGKGTPFKAILREYCEAQQRGALGTVLGMNCVQNCEVLFEAYKDLVLGRPLRRAGQDSSQAQ